MVILKNHLRFLFTYKSQHSVKRCISPPFFSPSPSWYPPFRNMHPPIPTPFWHHLSQENTWFYDNTLESGRLKTVNINHGKLLPIETVCFKYRMCPDRYHSDNYTIIVTAVGTGCNFPHGEIGTKFYHIKT